MATTDTMNAVQDFEKAEELAGKYLTFRLATEEYAIQILKVREIIRMQGITRVPQTPHYLKGVINLRGRVIAVMDLRLKFGMPEAAQTEKTCIIVVQIMRHGTQVTIGAIVDEVCEVLDMSAADIAPPPAFGTSVRTDFILGVAKAGSDVKIILDVDLVLTTEEASLLASVVDSHASKAAAGQSAAKPSERKNGSK